MKPTEIRILSSRPYDVAIAPGLLDRLGERAAPLVPGRPGCPGLRQRRSVPVRPAGPDCPGSSWFPGLHLCISPGRSLQKWRDLSQNPGGSGAEPDLPGGSARSFGRRRHRRPGRLCRRHIPPGHSLPPGPNHPPGHGGQLRRWKNRHQPARWEKPGRRILFPPPGAVRYRHTLHPAACRVSGGVWGNHQICSPHRSAFDRPGAGGHQPPHPGDHCPLCGSQGEPGASR